MTTNINTKRTFRSKVIDVDYDQNRRRSVTVVKLESNFLDKNA